ncbi:MAG: ethanolamine utilization cob(I)yrinic acid a,c-diamide adenosyltransferase EutT [Proteobacteria bacterium]|jgi:ethanolamine utilization cobalamin adenosyltransferase|nr:ethanolamine utilization cob(I)yrinic acid a,c-diamide adenosyltransferase EutT [Pseudomonadota bacterium]
MMTFITEDWLREHFGRATGTEIQLPANARLTPAARSLIEDRHLVVKFINADGSVFVEQADADGKVVLAPVHVLTGDAEHHAAHCALCQQVVTRKSAAMTHLNADTMVAKNDERIRLRGLLDSTIALAIWAQTEFDPQGRRKALAYMLADIRSWLGNVLRAEVTGEQVSAISMGELNEARIHALSHQPLKELGHDHIVPALEHGASIAKLNLLRARIRECEVQAADLYMDRDFELVRPDILQALNRLSSAVYVLMILVLLQEAGKPLPNLGGH